MLSKVKQARKQVEALRLALLSPAAEDLSQALPALEEAARGLMELERECGEGTKAIRRELVLLKRDLRIIARLIDQGMAFCRGWAKLLGVGPGYTPGGHAVVSPLEGTLSVRG
jgi:hypothetical protein